MRWPRMPSSVFVPHRRLRPARLIAPLAAMTIGACAERPPADDLTPVKRDSAGVEIVEMGGSPWSAPAWASVDTAKALRIVPDDSRPETLFARLRGALRLPDGRIAVLDVGRQRVQLFAADGSFLWSLGRQGQGPGELDQPWRLVRTAGDSIAVYDMAGHLELLSLSGDGARRVRVPTAREGGPAQILGAFASGGYLAIVNEFPGKVQPGTLPLFSTIQVMGSNGESGPSLGRHQSAQFTFEEVDGRLRQVETFFWAEPGMAVLPTGFAWCLTTQFDCQIWSSDGRHLRTIRASVPAAAVTDDDIEQVIAMRLPGARTADDTVRVRRTVHEAHRTERFPVASLIRSDSRGRIWMRPFVWRLSDLVAHWVVFEQSGRVLGTVALPANLQVSDVGENYILGTERGVDDVEGVVMYSYEVR